jgi:hypothetical protein
MPSDLSPSNADDQFAGDHGQVDLAADQITRNAVSSAPVSDRA